MPTRSLPSPALLRELLAYEPRSGSLTWRPRTGKWSSRWNKRWAGKPAGTVTTDGYVMIQLQGRNIPAHRAACAIYLGLWPSTVRHSNGDRSDNRVKNLRARITERVLREHLNGMARRTSDS